MVLLQTLDPNDHTKILFSSNFNPLDFYNGIMVLIDASVPELTLRGGLVKSDPAIPLAADFCDALLPTDSNIFL